METNSREPLSKIYTMSHEVDQYFNRQPRFNHTLHALVLSLSIPLLVACGGDPKLKATPTPPTIETSGQATPEPRIIVVESGETAGDNTRKQLPTNRATILSTATVDPNVPDVIIRAVSNSPTFTPEAVSGVTGGGSNTSSVDQIIQGANNIVPGAVETAEALINGK